MVDIVLLQTVSMVIASTGVVVAAIYYSLQTRHQTNIRQTESFWRILSTFNSKEFAEASFKVLSLDFKDYEDFTSKYGDLYSEKCTVNVPIAMTGDLFEGAGFLFRRGLIEYEAVNKFPVAVYWEKLKTIAEEIRKQHGRSQVWTDFEYMYNEMQVREQQQASRKA